MISIEVQEGRLALEALAPEWDALLQEVQDPCVFQTLPWLQAWLDVYDPGRIVILTARRQGQLVGVLPMIRQRTDARGLYLTRVAPLAPGISDYQSPLVAAGQDAEVLPALWDAAARALGGGVYWFPHQPETGAALPVLRQYLARRGWPVFEESEMAPRIRFPASWADLEKRWTASWRKDVRRQRKRLEEQAGGPLEIWQPASAAEGHPVLDEFFRVHDHKWVEQGFPGIFADVRVRDHFHAMLSRLHGRGLHFSTLRCGGVDISYHFGFLYAGWLCWYRPSFRYQYQVYSPSKVHIGMLMEQGHAAGWKGFDFLLGDEGYKLQWADEQVRIVSLHAGTSAWSPAYFWFSRGKPWLRAQAAGRLMRWKGKLRKWRDGRQLGTAPDGAPAVAPETLSPAAEVGPDGRGV